MSLKYCMYWYIIFIIFVLPFPGFGHRVGEWAAGHISHILEWHVPSCPLRAVFLHTQGIHPPVHWGEGWRSCSGTFQHPYGCCTHLAPHSLVEQVLYFLMFLFSFPVENKYYKIGQFTKKYSWKQVNREKYDYWIITKVYIIYFVL